MSRLDRRQGFGSNGTYIGSERRVMLGPQSRLVTNATAASPVVVTTSAAHGYVTGQRVIVGGVAGVSGVNGAHTITVLSATTFELDDSTGSGVYTSSTGACCAYEPGGQAVIDHITIDTRSLSVAFANVQVYEGTYDPVAVDPEIYENAGLSNGGGASAARSREKGLGKNQANTGLSIRGSSFGGALYVRPAADQYLQVHWRWVAA